jgi:hypothetical protein
MPEKRSPRRRSYSQFLRGEVSKESADTKKQPATKKPDNPQVKEISLAPPGKEKRSDIKIIRRPSSRKSKNRFTRKSHEKVDKGKDINYIERVLSQQLSPKEVVPKAKEYVSEGSTSRETDPKVISNPPKSSPPHTKSRIKRDVKRPIKRRSRSNRRPVMRTKGRKVSIHNKRIKSVDVEKIEKQIQAIRNKSSKEIRSELSKDGIHVSGKSNRLLKDIYFYSKVCNININHEK